MLFAYALWCLLTPATLTQAVASAPELTSMMRPIEDLARTIYRIVYGVMMLIAVFAQGGRCFFTGSPATSQHVRGADPGMDRGLTARRNRSLTESIAPVNSR